MFSESKRQDRGRKAFASNFDLRKVHFGFASAETESTQEPQLLLDGFYDAERLTDEAITGHRFIFLGYKGSGKSALAQRLKLLSEHESQLFVETLALGEFPFSHFTRIVKSTGPAEQEAHFPAVWTWILLLYLIDSFSRDAGARVGDGLNRAILSLRQLGVLPTGEVKLMVLKTAKTGLKGIIPRVGEASQEKTFEQNDSEALSNVEILKDLTQDFSSQSPHLLVIDGLDDILTQKNVQYNVLAALVLAVARLNQFFARNGQRIKVLLLCRTDLFARLPIPNKNKLRQDLAVELDWYHDPRDPRESGLVRLANLRTKLVFPSVDDLFEHAFPRRSSGRDIRTLLCDNTRHTPRDFLQLLVHVQRYADPEKVSMEMILKGIREYSIKYFLPEIHDELVGYMSTQNAALAFGFFGSLRRREFSLRELQAVASKNDMYKTLDLRHVLEQMFECSAVGNVEKGLFWFKYRNRDSSINFAERLVFHPGLWKALNVADNA